MLQNVLDIPSGITYQNRLGMHIIICPIPVLSVWETEIQKIYPNQENGTKFLGKASHRTKIFTQILSCYGNCIILMPYSMMEAFLTLSRPFKLRFDSITWDESHLITDRYKYSLELPKAAHYLLNLTGKLTLVVS